jgi:septal ring factor EnvC (AmiA/AmiB activator)
MSTCIFNNSQSLVLTICVMVLFRLDDTVHSKEREVEQMQAAIRDREQTIAQLQQQHQTLSQSLQALQSQNSSLVSHFLRF